jgi:hypothetical protein
MSDEPLLFAWIGEDEYGSGEIGLKQAVTGAGIVPLVATTREKVTRGGIVSQLQAQADRHNKTIRLVRYRYEETMVVLKPRPQG